MLRDRGRESLGNLLETRISAESMDKTLELGTRGYRQEKPIFEFLIKIVRSVIFFVCRANVEQNQPTITSL
jgi:hypothetical protein